MNCPYSKKIKKLISSIFFGFKKINYGFTLLELLIAMAILGILTSFLFTTYSSTQKKARDAQRKSDLREIQEALEMYLNDKGLYPASSNGQIVGCGACNSLPSVCLWDNQPEFRDTVPANCGAIYMKKLPKDPLSAQNYYYWVSTDQKSYKLYACLENTRDSKIITPSETVNCGGCGGSCNYGVASSNVVP